MFPNSYQLQQLPQVLTQINHIDGIPLDAAWTHGEVLAALRKLFPQLFQYFDILPSTNGQPHFLVCTKQQRKLLVLADPQPDGQRLFINRGTNKAKWSESYICLGMSCSHRCLCPY